MRPVLYREISKLEFKEKVWLVLREWCALALGCYLAWLFSIIQLENYRYVIERALSQIAPQRAKPWGMR